MLINLLRSSLCRRLVLKDNFSRQLCSKPIPRPTTQIVKSPKGGIQKIPEDEVVFTTKKRLEDGWEMIYGNPKIKLYAWMIKIKLGAAVLFLATIPGSIYAFINKDLTLNETLLLSCAAPMFFIVLMFYSKLYMRIIGKILYDPNSGIVKFAVLSRTGSRRDVLIPVHQIRSLQETNPVLRSPVLRIYAKEYNDFFVMIVHRSIIVDRERINEIFKWAPPIDIPT